MRAGRLLMAGAAAAMLALPAAAGAQAGGSAAWLRAAATKLITAEIGADGAMACSVLNAPLTATVGGRTCAQRWDARSAALMASARGAARLRADLAAVASAAVRIDGEHGSIALPHPLLDGHSRFYWTNNCWMLTR